MNNAMDPPLSLRSTPESPRNTSLLASHHGEKL